MLFENGKFKIEYIEECIDNDANRSFIFTVDIKDFDSVEEYLKRKIKNDNGFTFTGCDIIFKGICPECKKSAKI